MAIDNNNLTADDEFEGAFNEQAGPATEISEDDAFGITPPEDGAAAATGEPAAVVIVAEEGAAGDAGGVAASSEEAANAQAAESAKAVTDEANAKASVEAATPSTATQEAATEGGKPEGSPAEEAAESPVVEAAEAAGGLDDTSDVPAEDMQKFKSWQGRLKKIEAELKAKAANGGAPNGDVSPAQAADETTAEALSEVADQAEGANPALADEAGQLAGQVDRGEISPEEAMKSLAEDFGEPFVRMIEAIARSSAGKAADEKIGKVSENVEKVISHIKDSSERAHFEAIYEAHPDFLEVSKSPEFQAFVQASGAEAIAESGSAKEINKLLDDFQAQQAAPAQEAGTPAGGEVSPAQDAVAAADAASGGEAESDPALDDAEGVRSGGLRLPDEPQKGADDFVGAWNQF
jgi:hypothetical protein